MKYFISLLASVLFLPSVLIGTFIGKFLTEGLGENLTSFELLYKPYFFDIIAGLMGGCLAGFVVILIIKKHYHFWAAIILPTIFMIVSIITNFHYGHQDQIFLNVLLIVFYIIYIKSKAPR